MDLNDYIPKTDDVVVELKVKDTVLTNEDGSPMTITFYSPYSTEAKNIKHAMVDERIAKAEKSEDTTMSSKEVEELNTLGLARNIKAWNITLDGKQPKLTEKNAVDVLMKAFWIKPLYEGVVEKSVGFMKG